MHLAQDAQGVCEKGVFAIFIRLVPGGLSALHQMAKSPCYIIQSSSNNLLTACRPGIEHACGKESKLLKCFVKNAGMYRSKRLSITPTAFGLQSSIAAVKRGKVKRRMKPYLSAQLVFI